MIEAQVQLTREDKIQKIKEGLIIMKQFCQGEGGVCDYCELQGLCQELREKPPMMWGALTWKDKMMKTFLGSRGVNQ